MADQRVDIKVRVPLEVDTGAAERAIANLPAHVKQAAERATQAPGGPAGQQSAKQEVDLLTQVERKLISTIGPQGSFIKNKKEINTLYKEELAHVRMLEDNLSRLKRTEHGLSSGYIRARERETQEARQFVNRLRDTIAVGTAQESMTGGAARGGLFEMSTQQAMNGGLIGAGMGAIGRAVMAHPLIAGTALALGGANWLVNRADDASRYSEDIDVGFTNAGRRTGMGKGLRRLFQHARPGVTDTEFMNLGYTGDDLTKMVDAFGIPSSSGNLRSAIQAQGLFARAYGFGENPDAIAAVGRRSTQLGIAESGQQTQFWRSMTAAVEAGMKNGVDASETMRSMMGLSEQAASRLGVISADYKNGLMGVQALLSNSDSRFFKGERGAQELSSLMGAFQQPKSIAHERFMMNAIMGQFGGRVPTGKEIGLNGARAGAFDAMTEMQQMQTIMQILPELMGNGKNPKLFSGLAGEAARAAGPNGEMLMLQALTGKEGGALLEMTGALSSAVEKKFGKKRAKSLEGHPLLMMESLGEALPDEIQRMMRGKKADGSLTGVEGRRSKQDAMQEVFSADIATATEDVRLLGIQAKLAAEKLAILAGTEVANTATNTSTSNPLTGLFPFGAMALDAVRRGMHGKSVFGSSGAK